jgi:hypothetical protein
MHAGIVTVPTSTDGQAQIKPFWGGRGTPRGVSILEDFVPPGWGEGGGEGQKDLGS